MKNTLTLLAVVAGLASLTVSGAKAQAPAPVISGTPYLDENYVQGEIHYGTTKRAVPIRYNIFSDVMEYKQGNQPLVVDPVDAVKKVIIGTTTFYVQKFEFKGKTKNGFLALVDSGKVMLFSKKVVTFLDARKGGALDGGDLPARFTRAPDAYYYKIGDGQLEKLESIKSLIATFPAKQEELTAFAKKEKVSLRKENTLVQLVQYYNSL